MKAASDDRDWWRWQLWCPELSECGEQKDGDVEVSLPLHFFDSFGCLKLVFIRPKTCRF